MLRSMCLSVLAVLVLLAVICPSHSQISFSPNWGSGKRSGSPFRPSGRQDEDAMNCISKTEINILQDLYVMVQKQAKETVACLLQNKDIDFD